MSSRHLVARARTEWSERLGGASREHTVIAVGKAAAPMASAWLAGGPPPRRGLVLGTHRGDEDLGSLHWQQGGHPVPNAGSLDGARLALELARAVPPEADLVVLLSGGASAAMALPQAALTLDDKQAAVAGLLGAGADIFELNTIRKHLSAVKGGRLAAACGGRTWTFAVSDVVDDDPAVIGSGPTVPDASTFTDALAVVDGLAVRDRVPAPVVAHLEAGGRGEVEESVKPGDPRITRSDWRMLAGRHDAMAGARAVAEARGYHTLVLREPIVGIAREAAARYLGALPALLTTVGRPACLVSSGETTVQVRGTGRGGRNQEFVLALVEALADGPAGTVVASAGTDGIDGPTDAAGAVADTESAARGRAAGLSVAAALADNDAYSYFAALGDLIRIGPTDTNVGDVQVVLVP